SGWPASGMQSVTVLVTGDRAGTRSDALSKPLFIGDAAGLAKTAARLNVDDYLAVNANGQMQVSAAMQARLR
ncbi:MAG: FAD:protein FMN transferase, partial [Gammaproteobacteria bacterium]|nr:FAD:protein FMN transferase [Gammaproteobacteria bacterium]